MVNTARRLTQALSEKDELGRYGGEEFLIVSRREPDDLAAFAEELRTRIAMEPIAASNAQLAVTASFGVFSRNGQSTAQSQTLLKAADEALYQAKHAGRNRVVIG
jgi:diguanylate cyclase (GGDEF)-like protein